MLWFCRFDVTTFFSPHGSMSGGKGVCGGGEGGGNNTQAMPA